MKRAAFVVAFALLSIGCQSGGGVDAGAIRRGTCRVMRPICTAVSLGCAGVDSGGEAPE